MPASSKISPPPSPPPYHKKDLVQTALYNLQNSRADSSSCGYALCWSSVYKMHTALHAGCACQCNIVLCTGSCVSQPMGNSPLWGLITDGAYKKHMRGATGVVKVWYICMESGEVLQRHMGLVKPKELEFWLRRADGAGTVDEFLPRC